MGAFLLAFLLFGLSFLLNAGISKLSAERVLGIKLPWIKAGGIVLFRSLAAIVAGLLVGYLAHLDLAGELSKLVINVILTIGVGIVSYLAYWYMLSKLVDKPVGLWQFTKTIFFEIMYFILFLFVSFVVIYVLMLLFPYTPTNN